MRFTKIHLANWRNFTSVEVPLQQRMFLVGPNASGKSNLLDVFRFLHDLVRVGGGLEQAVNQRGGLNRLRSLIAHHPSDIVIDVHIEHNSNIHWRYRLSIAQDSNSRPYVQEEKIWKSGQLILNRPDERDNEDKELLRQTHLEQTSANRKFRDIADFFNSIRYYHIVPQLIRNPELLTRQNFDPFGRDFLERIANSPKETQEFLIQRLQKTLRIVIPQLEELAYFQDKFGVPHLRAKYIHWHSKEAWQTEIDFSDGTLRLIGLLWALLDDNGPLILEEPEISLHTEIVKRIPEMMASMQKGKARQLLVSTHSSDLLDNPGIAPDEVLLLRPTDTGTLVQITKNINEIQPLLHAGLPISDTVIPLTRPSQIDQLSFFGE